MDSAVVERLRREARERAATRPQAPELATVMDDDIDGTAFRRYTQDMVSETGWVAIFAHGGYFVFGDLDLQDRYCRRLARAMHGDVVSVDYGLAPERSATNSVEDVMRCIDAARASSANARILLVGDSAGGAIAFLAAGNLRDVGRPVDALFLTNPNLDLTLASFDPTAPSGPDLALLSDAIRAWAGPDPVGSGFSPLHKDLRGMPPTVIAVGALDALRPEACETHERLQDSGVDSQLRVFEGIGRGFMGGESPRETAAREDAFTTVDALLASLKT